MIAPDKFKGSLTAREAAEAIARGVRRAEPGAVVELCPMADGGEGTVEAMVTATGGEARGSMVHGPLVGQRVSAAWGVLGGEGSVRTAVLEMAAASGLALVPMPLRDPTKTTTRGTGDLIAEALDAGARRIVLGIGGSATTDGGCGMASALGVRFFSDGGRELETHEIVGGVMERLERIDIAGLDQRIRETSIRVACDVTNPLAGPTGAAHVFGPQKGATPAQVESLDRGLRRLARLWRRDLGVEVESMPGAGAAGGLGGGLAAFLGARLQPGIDMVLDATRFADRVRHCELCLTGEGRIDATTAGGKVVSGVARAAGGVPTVALAGSEGEGAAGVLGAGLAAYCVIGRGLPSEESIRRAAELLEDAAARVVRTWKTHGVVRGVL